MYKENLVRFQNNPRVTLIHGDSGVVLEDALKLVDAPATLWLDGHFSNGDTVKGIDYTPILRELECIQSHNIKSHTIIIDDIRISYNYN